MYLPHHQTSLFYWRYLELVKKEINGLYFVHTIRGFIFSLFGIFIPVYLLTLEFCLFHVITFFIARQTAEAAFSVVATGPISNRYGLKHTMLASLPLTIIYLACLASLKTFPSPWLFLFVATIGGIQASLYWIPLHSLFAHCTKTGHRSSQVGKLLSLQYLGSLAGPFLGGVISLFFGFESLFAISFLLMLVPFGILLYTPETKPHVNYSFKKGLFLFRKYSRHFLNTFILMAGNSSEAVLWPIFVFMTIKDSLAVGTVGTLMGIGTVLFTLLVGKTANRHNRKNYLKISALMLACVWIGKYFADTKTMIFLLSTFAGFFTIMFSIPHSAETYAIARKERRSDEFIIFREIPVSLGKIAILLVALLMVSNIELSFLITALTFLAALFI